MGDIWHSRINMVNFFYAEQVNISNGNFFSYRGELSKNSDIYVSGISLLTFFRWLGWYDWARFYVVVKVIHGFWIKVSYKENKITMHLRLFLLFDFFGTEYIEIKYLKRETVFQGVRIPILSLKMFFFITMRKDARKLPHQC